MTMDFVLLFAIVAGISAVLIVGHMAFERHRAKREREEDERALRQQEEIAARQRAARDTIRAHVSILSGGVGQGVGNSKPTGQTGSTYVRGIPPSTAPTAKAAAASTRIVIDDAKYTPQSDAIADGLLMQAIMSADYSRPSLVERSPDPEPSRECSTSSSSDSGSSSCDSGSSSGSSDSSSW